MKIGVFDSGVGGLSVANAIEQELYEHEVIYRQDKQNLPYGTKSREELIKLVYPILRLMEYQGCEIIIIACNTVTTTILEYLQAVLKVTLIGVEPMVKPASRLTKSKIIAVCATPATLGSERYRQIIKEHASDIVILEPDCSEWAYMIEQDRIDRKIIRNHISNVCEQGADVIVLGCTHYHWIEKDVRAVAEEYGAEVLQPEQAIIKNLKKVLGQLG